MHEITAEPKYLSAEERGRTRALYQAAFPEDTERFVDFYYQYKTRDNQILALEQDGQIVSMLPSKSLYHDYEWLRISGGLYCGSGDGKGVPSSGLYEKAVG